MKKPTKKTKASIKAKVDALSDSEVDQALSTKLQLAKVERLIESSSTIPPYRNQNPHWKRG